MDEMLLRSDQFMVNWPCFAMMAEDCKGPFVQPISANGSPGLALVILTDEDLLRKFRADGGHVSPTIRFELAGQLLFYLEALPEAIGFVWLDPSASKPNVVSVGDVMRSLIRHIEGGKN
jgi:hypothetical protein